MKLLEQQATQKRVANAIKTRRETLKISQSQLARKIGVSQASIQKIESGETENSRYIPQIWAHLGMPMGELDPVFAESLPANGPPSITPNEPSEESLADKVLRMMQDRELTVAQDAYTHVARDFVGVSQAIAVSFIRRDGTTHTVVMPATVARALVHRLTERIGEQEIRKP